MKQDKEGAKRISDLCKKLAFLYANIPEEKKDTFLRDGKRNFSTAMAHIAITLERTTKEIKKHKQSSK